MSDTDGTGHCNESTWFCGLARVSLDSLTFEKTLLNGHREVSSRNVERLVDIFRTEGCKRVNAENFVKAKITRHELDAALTFQHLTLPQQPPEDWRNIPILKVASINCVNGLHRVLAAREYLDTNDQWWIAKLYLEGLPRACTKQIAEGYGNEQSHTDGEIFRKIRQYHRRGDEHAENRWWARLSKNKRGDLRQLLKIRSVVKVFDIMIPWQGPWDAIDIGAFRRITRLKCYEEVSNYLRHIVFIWSSILDGTSDSLPAGAVDTNTVHRLETLCPKMSTVDAELVTKLMDDNRIFAEVHDDSDRAIIHSNLLECPMIPSLFTFIENLKYLEPCVEMLRTLLPSKPKRSIYQELTAAYFHPPEPVVEYGLHDIRPHPPNQTEVDLNIAYEQLWLFALRNFPNGSSTAPRMDTNIKHVYYSRDPIILQRFGEFAISLGFLTDAAKALAAQDGVVEVVTQLIDCGGVAAEELEHTKQKIVEILRMSGKQKSSSSSIPTMVGEEWLSRERRCGRPFQHDHDFDRPNLFLPVMYSNPSTPGHHVSTLYCKWEMFRGFFIAQDIPHMEFNSRPADSMEGVEASKSRNTSSTPQAGSDMVATLHAELEVYKEKLRHLETACTLSRSEYSDFKTAAAKKESELGHKIQALEGELERLKTQAQKDDSDILELARVHGELDQLRSEKTASANRISCLEEELADAKSRRDSIHRDLGSARSKLMSLDADKARMFNQISTLEQALAASKSQLQGDESLNRMLEKARQNISLLEEELSTARADTQNDSTNQALEEARSELVRLRTQKGKLKEKISSLQEELAVKSSHDADIPASEVRAIAAEAELASVRLSFDTERSALKEQLSTAQDRFRVEAEARKGDYDRIRSWLVASENEVESLKVKVNWHVKNLDGRESLRNIQLTFLKSELQQKTKELDSLKVLYNDLSASQQASAEPPQPTEKTEQLPVDSVNQHNGRPRSGLLPPKPPTSFEIFQIRRTGFLVELAKETDGQGPDVRLITNSSETSVDCLELRCIVLHGRMLQSSIVLLPREEAKQCVNKWELELEDLELLFGSEAPQIAAYYDSDYIFTSWEKAEVLWVVQRGQITDFLRVWSNESRQRQNLLNESAQAHAMKRKRKRSLVDERKTKRAFLDSEKDPEVPRPGESENSGPAEEDPEVSRTEGSANSTQTKQTKESHEAVPTKGDAPGSDSSEEL